MYDLDGKKIWVAGHRGMVGSAIVRRLAQENCTVLTADRHTVDLRDRNAVSAWLKAHRPDAICLAAARVGGILENSRKPVDFLLDNLLIETSVIASAHEHDVNRLLFLGSSCIYPKFAQQPIKESELLAGYLEPTNEHYAIAKIAGVKLAQAYRRQYDRDYISAMPTNLYGPGDNFDLLSSHVMPALIRKVDAARRTGDKVVVWGTGTPRREFLYVDDCADACVYLLKYYHADEHINVGSGSDISIKDLTIKVMNVIGYEGDIVYDTSKPDGTPRKLMDNAKINELGWSASFSLDEGIRRSYHAFLDDQRY